MKERRRKIKERKKVERRGGKKKSCKEKEKYCGEMKSSWKVERNFYLIIGVRVILNLSTLFWLNKEIFNKILVSAVLCYNLK